MVTYGSLLNLLLNSNVLIFLFWTEYLSALNADGNKIEISL